MDTNINEIMGEIGLKYSVEKRGQFGQNWLKLKIEAIPKSQFKEFQSNGFIFLKASAGQGNWAFVPWVAFLDKRETSSPQDGVYVVYLFSMDGQRVYLTLAQGVTKPLNNMKRKKGLEFLTLNAINIRKAYPSGFSSNPIDLGDSSTSEEYEASMIYQKEYQISNLPENQVLAQDLTEFLKLYEQYVVGENIETGETDFTNAPGSVFENKMKLRTHYARERNQTIVKLAKDAKLRAEGKINCEICGFNFSEKYGEIGKNYIEAHHKLPLSETQGIRETKIEDFALICSNCHRMVHKRYPSYTLDEIKGVVR